MFPLHCNKCFQRSSRNITLQFYLSSCQHILCKECVQAECPVCRRTFKPNLISKNMPATMAVFFEDYHRIFHRFQRVAKFQMDNSSLLYNYHVNKLPAQLKKTQNERGALVKVEQRISEATVSERQRIQKLKDYLKFHERRMALKPYHPFSPRSKSGGSSKSSSDSACSSTRSGVQTPTLSLPDSLTEESTNDASCDFLNTRRNSIDFDL